MRGILVLATAALAEAGVLLPAIFKDGMVLQTQASSGPPASIFGYAAPDEPVTVNMTYTDKAGQPVDTSYHAVGDAATGRWRVQVAPAAADPEPAAVSFSIAGASDARPIVIRNATFGEVFLCSGQSNMVMSMGAASLAPYNASAPLQHQMWPNIRLFSVITLNASEPQRDLPQYVNRTATRCTWGWVNGSTPEQQMVCQTWQVAAPGVTDFFSAECFYTAVQLVQDGVIPPGRTIGLIQSAYSGTAMETWTPPEAFAGCPVKTWGAAWPLRLPSDIPSASSCLWNAMIAPIVGYGIRAALWNQIESNMYGGKEIAPGPSYPPCSFQPLFTTLPHPAGVTLSSTMRAWSRTWSPPGARAGASSSPSWLRS